MAAGVFLFSIICIFGREKESKIHMMFIKNTNLSLAAAEKRPAAAEDERKGVMIKITKFHLFLSDSRLLSSSAAGQGKERR